MEISIKNKNLIFSLIFSIIILSIISNTNSSLTKSFRNLLEEDESNKRCDKTLKKFKEKYEKETEDFELDRELDKYEKKLKEIIQTKEYGKITKYLPRIIIYLIVAIIGVIFIIFWILFCCFACKDVEKQNNIGCGAKCSFIIYIILCIGVIGFSVIGFLYFPCLNKTLNGLSCSIYRLVFHFLNGAENTYPDIQWVGINKFLEQLNETQNSLTKVESIKETFDNINNETLDDIEKYIDKWDEFYPYNSIIIFGGLLIFNLLALISLFFLFVCNCKCISCCFNFFWNIEIIFIIATFFLSSLIGAFSVVSKDVSNILIDQKKAENIYDKSNVFIFNFTENPEVVDLCLNGNGDLYNYTFYENNEKGNFIEKMKELNSTFEDEDVLKQLYNCTFFKNDYNILVDELKNDISKKLYYISLIIIIIDAAGIVSIFFGIIIYNSQKEFYPPPRDEQVNIYNNNRMMNNRIDLSTENLKKQNNDVIFPKKIK